MSKNGLTPVRTALPNGVVVLVQSTKTQPAVAINFAMVSGSVCDSADHIGIANFVAHVIDRGTSSRSAEALAEAFDNRGLSFAVRASRHRMILACNCLTDDFEMVLELVADIAQHPSFPDREVGKRRVETETAIRRDADSSAEAADDLVRALIYGELHPYGRRVSGTLDSLGRIDRTALIDFHRIRCVPKGATLTNAGDVNPSAVTDTVSRLFGDWSADPPVPVSLPPVPEANGRRRAVRQLPGKVQADIAYGFTGVARSDPRYHGFRIMNNVLGQFGLGGRLGNTIRERQGMAYYVFSGLEANIGPGPLIVRAGVSPANVDRAIASIDDEVGKMGADGVTDQELTDAKQFLVGSIPRMLETNAMIATFLQNSEQFDLGMDYDARLPGLFEAVTLDDVCDAAESLLAPDRASIAIAGPIDEDVEGAVSP